MSLSKSKCWYSNNFFCFFKVCCFIGDYMDKLK